MAWIKSANWLHQNSHSIRLFWWSLEEGNGFACPKGQGLTASNQLPVIVRDLNVIASCLAGAADLPGLGPQTSPSDREPEIPYLWPPRSWSNWFLRMSARFVFFIRENVSAVEPPGDLLKSLLRNLIDRNFPLVTGTGSLHKETSMRQIHLSRGMGCCTNQRAQQVHIHCFLR